MTLLFADGFDWWDDGSPNHIYQHHTDSINTIDDITRYNRGRSLYTTSSSGHTLRKIIPRTTTLVVGFAYYMQSATGNDYLFYINQENVVKNGNIIVNQQNVGGQKSIGWLSFVPSSLTSGVLLNQSNSVSGYQIRNRDRERRQRFYRGDAAD